jgi:hypothetical protein
MHAAHLKLNKVGSIDELAHLPTGTDVLLIRRDTKPSKVCNFIIHGKVAEIPEDAPELLRPRLLYLTDYVKHGFGQSDDIELHLGLFMGEQVCNSPIGYYLDQSPGTTWEAYTNVELTR